MNLNPVLQREVTERVRSRRTPLVLMAYLLVLTGFMAMTVRVARGSGGDVQCVNDVCTRTLDLVGAAVMGRTLLHWLLFLGLGALCFIVPGLTSGAIAGERERQTLVPLQVTLLTPRRILSGKLQSSLAFTLLLLVAALPLLSIVFWFGGVSGLEVLYGTAMLVAVSVVLASIAILSSTYHRSVQWATVSAYLLTFALVVGPLAVYGMQSVRVATGFAGGQGAPSPAVLVLSPWAALADVVRGQEGAGFNGASPLSWLQSILHGAGNMADGVGPARNDTPWWLLSLLAFAVISAGSLALSTLRLTTPNDR